MSGDRSRQAFRPTRAAVAASMLGLAALLAAVVLAPVGQAATRLPGGRANWVMAMMDGKPQALAVRLASYRFSTNGTVTERYWAWSQNGISGKGNVSWTKPPSGYRTLGCQYACPIRTPVGFQKGGKPHTYTGRWSMSSANVLTIRWSATYPLERWLIDTSQPSIAGAKLLSARNGGHGWMVGSRASLSRGVSVARIHQSGWITGPFAENSYSPKIKNSWIGLSSRDYSLCSTGTCLQAKKMTGADRTTWYHSYLAGNPAVDGRKNYWNNQTGVVQQMESPKSVCISGGGGHTNALLQVIDDRGEFAGFVGVEASLNQRKYGQAVVAAYAMLTPSLLSAIGWSQ